MNNPVTVTDYQNAMRVYGKDLGSIKGKTTRTKPQHVQFESSSFPERKKDIVLSVDIMHFIGINFLLSVSRDTKFITAGVLSDKRKITISKSIKQVLNLYKGKGHMVEKMDLLNLILMHFCVVQLLSATMLTQKVCVKVS